MRILADATLPHLSSLFKAPFGLTLYKTPNEIPAFLHDHDILLCRSTLRVNATLLAKSTVQCVATASSGIDHIDSEYLQKNKITLFDAKGCNARSVADYVVATLAYLYQQNKVKGRKAGIIGVGAVGTCVIARLQAIGFNVICFDPFKEKTDTTFQYCTLNDLATCDVLCVHANLHHTQPYPSANLLEDSFLSSLKPNTVIINAARGGIVNEEALLNQTFPLTYCTDVYSEEPKINAKVVELATLCTPHIAGHSIEAKNMAVIKISQQLHAYYGVPMPRFTLSREQAPLLSPRDDWKDCVANLYSPLIDTCILKSANNKTHAFLTQRQAHTTRHDFAFYDTRQLTQQVRAILANP